MTTKARAVEYVEKGNSGLQAKTRRGHGRQTLKTLAVAAVAAACAGMAASAVAADTYLAPSTSSDNASAYKYHNTFPAGVGDFATSKEVGGDVFAKGLKPGDKFPLDVTVFDENNKPHKLSELVHPGKPLILAMAFISAPAVMKDLAQFQKAVKAESPGSDVILVNVSQFGSALQPGTIMANTGRTIKVVGKDYGLTLPFYWVHNDIYAADGFTNRLRVRDLPTYFVVNGKGKIVRIFGSDHKQWKAADFKS